MAEEDDHQEMGQDELEQDPNMKFETALVSEEALAGKKKKKKKKKKKVFEAEADQEADEVIEEIDPLHAEAMLRTQEEMRRLEEENLRL